MKNLEVFCQELLWAQTETDIDTILSELSSQYNVSWKPYGGNPNNYSTFENQQTSAEGALIEKITNSIDHILIRQCLVKGINPKSEDAPKTMNEAKNSLFTNDELADVNNRPWVIADGPSRLALNLFIADTGEGQLADKFEDTLLSLQQGNKNDIAFVQGMFNMGSTGAVRFCGNKKYQLIVSKRHSSLNDADGKVGFTLVRRHVRTSEEQIHLKNTWYEYLVIDNIIPRFTYIDSISLVKTVTNEYLFTNGTVIKLFDYALKSKSQVFQQLRFQIESYLYSPIFDIEVCETRQFFNEVKKRPSNCVMNFAHGNKKNLDDAANKNGPYRLDFYGISTLNNPEWGNIDVQYYVLDRESTKKFKGDKNLVFLQNGQVQYFEKQSFITQKLGFKLLKKSLFIVVDCSTMNQGFRDQGFFMANRETIVHNDGTERFMTALISELKNNEELASLNSARAEINVSPSSTQELMEKVLGRGNKDKFLKGLFSLKDTGSRSRTEGENSGRKGGTSYPPKKVDVFDFPTYVEFKGAVDGHIQKEISLGGKSIVNIDINAVSDYFIRDVSPGIFTSSATTTAIDIIQRHPNNGKMSIKFEDNKKALLVGSNFSVTLSIKDKNGEYTCVVDFTVTEEAVKKGERANEGINLPNLIMVYKDQDTINFLNKSEEAKEACITWDDDKMSNLDRGLNKESVVRLLENPNGDGLKAIFVNMSSNCLNALKRDWGTTETKKVEIEDIYLSDAYLESFLLYSSFEQKNKNVDNLDNKLLDDFKTIVEDLISNKTYPSVAVKVSKKIDD